MMAKAQPVEYLSIHPNEQSVHNHRVERTFMGAALKARHAERYVPIVF